MKFQEFSSVYNLQKAFPTEQSCIDYLEKLRWNGNVVSPFDPESKVYKCANNRYRCKNTKKYFNIRTKTIFADSKLPLSKWIMGIYLFSTHGKGLSSLQLSKHLDIQQKASWFMLHRLRFAMAKRSIFESPLKGIVESDTCFVGGKECNKHLVNRFFIKSNEKAPVIGMVERGGRLRMHHVSKHSSSEVLPLLVKNIQPGTRLMTDEGHEFAGAYRYFEHKTIIHRLKEYVVGDVYTNTIEGAWSLLKRGILGTYHWTSQKYLQAYLDEFSYRYNVRKQSPYDNFNTVLEKSFMGHLKWKDLVGRESIQTKYIQ